MSLVTDEIALVEEMLVVEKIGPIASVLEGVGLSILEVKSLSITLL